MTPTGPLAGAFFLPTLETMPLKRPDRSFVPSFGRAPLPGFVATDPNEPAIPRNILDLHTAHALANSPLDLVICGVWNVRVTVGDLRTLIDELGPSAAQRKASRARVTSPPEDDVA